jgi:hypothetical protein
MRWLVAMLLLPLGQAALAAPVQAVDLTALVKQETDLDERIARACRDHCQGNRREGRLTTVSVVRTGAHHYDVQAQAALVNRQYQDPPRVLGRRVGGGVEVFSYTIDVEASGTLDDRTCQLRIDRIRTVRPSQSRRPRPPARGYRPSRRELPALPVGTLSEGES